MPGLHTDARQIKVPGGDNLWEGFKDLTTKVNAAAFGTLLTANTGATYAADISGTPMKTDSYLTLNSATVALSYTGFPGGGVFVEHSSVIKQDATGGRALTFSGITWIGGEAPEMPQTANDSLLIHIKSFGDGVQWGYHGQDIQTDVYCWPDAEFQVSTKAMPFRPRGRRIRIVGFRFYAYDPPAGGTTVLDYQISGTTSLFTSDANRPKLVAAGIDSGIINTHTTKLLEATQWLIPKIISVAPVPGGYGSMEMYFVES